MNKICFAVISETYYFNHCLLLQNLLLGGAWYHIQCEASYPSSLLSLCPFPMALLFSFIPVSEARHLHHNGLRKRRGC